MIRKWTKQSVTNWTKKVAASYSVDRHLKLVHLHRQQLCRKIVESSIIIVIFRSFNKNVFFLNNKKINYFMIDPIKKNGCEERRDRIEIWSGEFLSLSPCTCQAFRYPIIVWQIEKRYYLHLFPPKDAKIGRSWNSSCQNFMNNRSLVRVKSRDFVSVTYYYSTITKCNFSFCTF